MPDIEGITELESPISQTDIDTIISLHKSAFSNVLIGQLNNSFIGYLYHKINEYSGGKIFVFKFNNEIVGYLAGLADAERFYTLNYYKNGTYAFIKSIFIKPKIIISLIIYIYRKTMIKDSPNEAELLSMVVDPEYYRRGIGTELIQKYEEWLKSKSINNYKVYTDTRYSTGNMLYEKLGFKKAEDVCLFGTEYIKYVKDIDH